MRPSAVLLAAAAAVLVAVPASAEDPAGEPLVLPDPAGDAQVLRPGVASVPVVGTTPGSPSDDAADLRRVTVSSDGGTALVVVFETTGDPLASVPTGYELDVSVGACRSGFAAFPEGAPDGGPAVRWFQYGDGCPTTADVPGLGRVESDPRWTVTTAATSVALRIPLEALTPAQAAVLRPGAVLSAPTANSFRFNAVGRDEAVLVQVRGYQVDGTEPGRDWTFGGGA